MKGIRKNGFKGVAVAAALSMTMTTMVSPAATAEVLQMNMPQTSGFLRTGNGIASTKTEI